jgi:hypothetical protein
MRKITLLLNHETPTGNYQAGDEIEVTDWEYEYLIRVYMKMRQEEVVKEHAAKKVLDRITRALDD